MQTPISVRYFSDRPNHAAGTIDSYVLIAGGHRLAAIKTLGQETIECFVVEGDDQRARLWEISENLHRTDLTRLERAEQIAEWIEITESVLAQNGPKLKTAKPGRDVGGRPESGLRLASY